MKSVFCVLMLALLAGCNSGGSNSGTAVSGLYLSQINSAPNGWVLTCANYDAQTNIVSDIFSSGDSMTLQFRYFDDSDTNCTGPEVMPAVRINFVATGLRTINTFYQANLSVQSLGAMTSDSYLANQANTITDYSEYPGVVGYCGLRNWIPGQWQDVSNTICWNFLDGESIGTGEFSNITFDLDLIHEMPLDFRVVGNVLETDLGTYVRR